MTEKLTRYQQLLTELAADEGFNASLISGVGCFRASQPESKTHAFYEPLICLMGQGTKRCYVGDRDFTYQSGDFFINFLPMPVSTEVVSASVDQPLLSASLEINLIKLADMVLRIERLAGQAPEISCEKSSSLMIGRAENTLVELFIKLLEISHDPLDAKILGEQVVDEIYYRLLTSEHGHALRLLLNQYGEIQPISRAVNYIHSHTHQTIHVQELAELANMSKTRFFTAFKQIMHVPPMQYIKSSKLQKAQTLLRQGMSATEASFQVGYNSFSQFSREYKRFFGFSPSKTH
ncbi:AraC family transcriptional regulator [Marinomonas algarum]|uniref:AraC family transcriptional regulator n=1 Tax=Marinomonas algarum TaxID=2883105 RepID=A0A9X1LDZ3_9GAMM|nr:AraC family transcriptional regulator [Marinomonas algarum]MCB5160451.1 AraC family transcriptional regulator [Marinomonas algarum]